jgi:hypothetical protein
MTYQTELKREIDLSRVSIANTELCSVLELIAHSRTDEVKFHKYIAYAKQLQTGLFEMEVELKKQLK